MNHRKISAEQMLNSVSHAARVAALVAEVIARVRRRVIASIVGKEPKVLQCAISVARSVLRMMVCHVRCVGNRHSLHLLHHGHQHHLQHLVHQRPHHLLHPNHAQEAHLMCASISVLLIQRKTFILASISVKSDAMMHTQLFESDHYFNMILLDLSCLIFQFVGLIRSSEV